MGVPAARQGTQRSQSFTVAQGKLKCNSISVASAAALLPDFELRIFMAFYYPFTDENDGVFLTGEGSKQHLVVVVEVWVGNGIQK